MILVTGGAGFIGSNLVAALIERGEEVVICDRFHSELKWRNLAKHAIVDHVYPDDLYLWLDSNGDEINMIFHMGAVSATTECDVDLIMDSNFQMTMGLYQWACENNSRLIYASSAATYGNGELGFVDDESINPMSALRPLNAYGWSKQLVDINIKRQSIKGLQSGDLPKQWAGLKFFNVYGPNEYHKGGMRSVVHQLFEQINDNGEATLFKSHNPDYKDGMQMRDFVWVGDCIAAMLWLYDNESINGIFNCGSGKARTFSDLASAIFKSLNMPEEIKFRDTPENIRKHYQYFTIGDMAKLQQCGFVGGSTKLEDGVDSYIQNYLLADDIYR